MAATRTATAATTSTGSIPCPYFSSSANKKSKSSSPSSNTRYHHHPLYPIATIMSRGFPSWLQKVLMVYLSFLEGTIIVTPIHAFTTAIPARNNHQPTTPETTTAYRFLGSDCRRSTTYPILATISSSSSFLDQDEMTTTTTTKTASGGASSPLSLSLDDLSIILGGRGRAQLCWDCFRIGVDPLWFYNNGTGCDGDHEGGTITEPHVECLQQPEEESEGNNPQKMTLGWTRDDIQSLLVATPGHRGNSILGQEARNKLQDYFGRSVEDNSYSTSSLFSIETHVAELSKITVAKDGTTKLLLTLVQDGLQVETVIIPWHQSNMTNINNNNNKENTQEGGTMKSTKGSRRRPTSSLCVSSQVGCAQACRFCMTGRMGKIRSLSADEILCQVYWANKVCRLLPSLQSYPIDNVIFMGMGEPADNAPAVAVASHVMTNDLAGFQLAPRHVSISTVAPTPESFAELLLPPPSFSSSMGENKGSSSAPSAVLAWSVHSSKDEIRQQLVPTTRYSMVELRNGLRDALLSRGRNSKKWRSVMLEIALLHDINDAMEDAHHLAQTICLPLLHDVEGLKLVVNVIPWNDIGATFGPASLYRPPSPQRVRDYQAVLQTYPGISCYVRTARGDDESAACGMLATKHKNQN